MLYPRAQGLRTAIPLLSYLHPQSRIAPVPRPTPGFKRVLMATTHWLIPRGKGRPLPTVQ